MTQDMTNEGTQQGEKTLSEKNAQKDQENTEWDDQDETDSELMRFRESRRNKMLTELLIPSTKMDAQESYSQNSLPNFAFI